MTIGMIQTYRDLNRDTRLWARVYDQVAQTGSICRGVQGMRPVIEWVQVSIQAQDAGGVNQVIGLQLVTVNTSGVITPAAPNVQTIGPMFRAYRVGNIQWSGYWELSGLDESLDWRVQEGYGIGWYCPQGAIQTDDYALPEFINVAVGGRWEPTQTREGVHNSSGILQPSGGGI